MGAREPEVDPYFEEHIGKGYEETKETIYKYLELYLTPDIMSNIVFVDSSFFFEDIMLDKYRRVPSYQTLVPKSSLEKTGTPKAGNIIIDVSVVQNGRQEIKTMLHTILLFCILFSHLRDHPDDRRFIREDIGRKGTIHEFSSCFFWDMFHMTLAAKVRVIYVPLDLHAIYNSEDVSPSDTEIVKWKDDMMVVHTLTYSFIVNHTYQKDEYDGLSQEKLEAIVSEWDIDTVIKEYKKGTRRWLNDRVFASTLEWADDGFVYSLREGTDDLVDAFVNRNINLVRKFLRFEEPRLKGEYYSDELARDKQAIATWALLRNNKKIDDAYLPKAEKVDADQLLAIASADRFDLLLEVPVKNINIDEETPYTLRDFFRIVSYTLIERDDVLLLEKLFVKYWPVLKKAPLTEDMSKFIKSLVILDIQEEAIVYKVLKKVDKNAISEWLKSIKPPTFSSIYNHDWIYFIRDDVYNDLERVNPIRDEDIRTILAKLKNPDTINNLKINERLKQRMLEIYAQD